MQGRSTSAVHKNNVWGVAELGGAGDASSTAANLRTPLSTRILTLLSLL